MQLFEFLEKYGNYERFGKTHAIEICEVKRINEKS